MVNFRYIRTVQNGSGVSVSDTSERFRTVQASPNYSEPFRTIPNYSELFRTQASDTPNGSERFKRSRFLP